MPSIRQLQTRIKSVQTTAKITGAMQAVAAMRLKKYTAQSNSAHKYGQELREILKKVVSSLSDFDNSPLLKSRNKGKSLVIIVGPSRGFCGGLHRSVVLNAYQGLKDRGIDPTDPNQVEFITLNKPAYRMMTKLGGKILAFFNGPFKDLNPYKILPVSELIFRLWAQEDSRFADIFIAFAEPTSSLKAKLHLQKILPLTQNDLGEEVLDIQGEHTFLENDIEKFLDEFLPQWLEMNIHQALLETMAAEEGARMMAMNQASDNAKRLTDKLKLVYFRQRQAKITQEISEIVGGSL